MEAIRQRRLVFVREVVASRTFPTSLSFFASTKHQCCVRRLVASRRDPPHLRRSWCRHFSNRPVAVAVVDHSVQTRLTRYWPAAIVSSYTRACSASARLVTVPLSSALRRSVLPGFAQPLPVLVIPAHLTLATLGSTLLRSVLLSVTQPRSVLPISAWICSALPDSISPQTLLKLPLMAQVATPHLQQHFLVVAADRVVPVVVNSRYYPTHDQLLWKHEPRTVCPT